MRDRAQLDDASHVVDTENGRPPYSLAGGRRPMRRVEKGRNERRQRELAVITAARLLA